MKKCNKTEPIKTKNDYMKTFDIIIDECWFRFSPSDRNILEYIVGEYTYIYEDTYLKFEEFKRVEIREERENKLKDLFGDSE